jgi:endonuclease/exonuclease/phosphatase family metal-dependent hydrolase
MLLVATLLVLGLQQHCQKLEQIREATESTAARTADSPAQRARPDSKPDRKGDGEKRDDERARKPRTADKRTAEPRTADKRTADKRTADRRTADKRTADRRTADKRTAEPRTAAAPPGRGLHEHVRVGTWNLKRLGHGKKELDRVAEIIEDFDVIALQEVMTPEGVAELLAYLPDWDAELSNEPVGRGKYTEWYAVLYRKDRVRVERAFLASDSQDEFAREPFVTCLVAGSFDFCLVSIHVIYGNSARARDEEISALGRMVGRLRAREREKDWIVVGDFNRVPGAPGWDVLVEAGWSFTCEGNVATSLGKKGYHNAYDHILVDRAHTRELAGPCQRIDFVARACNDDFDACSRELSDHAPVMARFRTTGPDDD